MPDDQLKGMLEMMKNNRGMLKQTYEAQGMKMTDEQLDAMMKMMTPEMMKQSIDMAAKNPDLIKQAVNKMGGAAQHQA